MSVGKQAPVGDKVRFSFTCSGCFVWLLVGGVLLVLLSNTYAWGRLLWAERQAEALALDLGYTPEQFVYSTGAPGWGIIIEPCDAAFYFTTPLAFADFEAQLLAVRPGTRQSYPPPEAEWFLPFADVSQPDITHVAYYAAGHKPHGLPIGLQPLAGNTTVIEWPAGDFPPWTPC